MSGRVEGVMYQVQHSCRMICGVCADIADRIGIPVWLVRVAAVLLLVAHPPLTVAVYFGAAIFLRGRAPATWRANAPPAWDRDGLGARFRRLDERLARMESAALDREMGRYR
jgi:phage shock protein PspC (stress-responsive transcriptional regulator)